MINRFVKSWNTMVKIDKAIYPNKVLLATEYILWLLAPIVLLIIGMIASYKNGGVLVIYMVLAFCSTLFAIILDDSMARSYIKKIINKE